MDSSSPSFCESIDIVKTATDGILDKTARCDVPESFALLGLYESLDTLHKRALDPNSYPPVALRSHVFGRGGL